MTAAALVVGASGTTGSRVATRLAAAIASGAEDRTTDTVERVTGTPPRSFRDFAVADFRP